MQTCSGTSCPAPPLLRTLTIHYAPDHETFERWEAVVTELERNPDIIVNRLDEYSADLYWVQEAV